MCSAKCKQSQGQCRTSTRTANARLMARCEAVGSLTMLQQRSSTWSLPSWQWNSESCQSFEHVKKCCYVSTLLNLQSSGNTPDTSRCTGNSSYTPLDREAPPRELRRAGRRRRGRASRRRALPWLASTPETPPALQCTRVEPSQVRRQTDPGNFWL